MPKHKTFIDKFMEVIRDFLDRVKGVQGKEIEKVKGDFEHLLDLLDTTVKAGAENANILATQQSNKSESKTDIRKSNKPANKKITVGMTDSDRTDILKTKSIVAEVYNGQADKEIDEYKSDLESGKKGLIKSALWTIGNQFNVRADYNIKDVDVKITLSNGNLKESVSKPVNPKQIAKLIPIFKTAVENAVGIEEHINRYFYDRDTVTFHNLVSGYIDGDKFIPIRFGLKHRKNGETVLYVVVDNHKIDLNKIKAEPFTDTAAKNTQRESEDSAFTINIKDIVPFVNGKDLLRYIPDDMINDNQKRIKWEAIAETIVKTNDKNDKKYSEYIKENKLTNAKDMVKAAAEYYGYTIEAWHGTRQTFTAFSKDKRGNNTRTELSKKWFFAGDKDTANSYYPYGVIKELYGAESADKMRKELKGNLYHLYIKMENPLVVDAAGYDYSAHREKADAFMEYVKQAEKNGNDGIILFHVRDNQLKPSAEESTIYLFKEPSQAKSGDVITYNDNDEIIPISKRFDETVDDMRYSKKVFTGEEDQKRIVENAKQAYPKLKEFRDETIYRVVEDKDFYDRIGWAYANGAMSQQTAVKFNKIIANKQIGAYVPKRKGLYYVLVNDNIVVTDGKFKIPKVYGVIKGKDVYLVYEYAREEINGQQFINEEICQDYVREEDFEQSWCTGNEDYSIFKTRIKSNGTVNADSIGKQNGARDSRKDSAVERKVQSGIDDDRRSKRQPNIPKGYTERARFHFEMFVKDIKDKQKQMLNIKLICVSINV